MTARAARPATIQGSVGLPAADCCGAAGAAGATGAAAVLAGGLAVAGGRLAAACTVKLSRPVMGWPSAELTRQMTSYLPGAAPACSGCRTVLSTTSGGRCALRRLVRAL